VVGVTDNSQRTLAHASILEDDQLGRWLLDRGLKWRVFDVGQAAYGEYRYDQALAARGLSPPAVLLVDKTFNVVRAAPAPPDSNGVKAFVEPPQTLAEYVDKGGTKRKLDRLLPTKKSARPFGGRWAEVCPMIPRDQWREVSHREAFKDNARWIYDQDYHGSCVGNGATAGMRKCRFLAGMFDVRLAPGCTYAQINGGSDDGANISDSLAALQATGTITTATLGSDEDKIYLREMPAGWKDEARRFRIEDAYRCDTFDEMGSALQLGYLVVYGMQVGNSFERFTSEGVAGVSHGVGNHCMYADGMHRLGSGPWAFDNVNSWGATWGPWGNGRCYLIEGHFLNGCQPDAYAIKTCVEDPREPNKPGPVVVGPVPPTPQPTPTPNPTSTATITAAGNYTLYLWQTGSLSTTLGGTVKLDKGRYTITFSK